MPGIAIRSDQPPTTGPTAGATMAQAPAMVVARTRRPRGIRMKTPVKTGGISMPPKKPCITRMAISKVMPVLKAQARLATVKPSVAAMNKPRRVKRAGEKAGEGNGDDFGG